jgi:hypothetical protein
MPHPATLPIDQLLAVCTAERTRRGGPGGQHRNKVETAVVLHHQPTGIRAEASERRSQAANHAQAVQRLRVRLALDIRGEAGGAPSHRWTARVASRRLATNVDHEDFPALLAEALDVLASQDWNVAGATDFLHISATQLVKLLKLQPEALAQLNRKRQARGQPALR